MRSTRKQPFYESFHVRRWAVAGLPTVQILTDNAVMMPTAMLLLVQLRHHKTDIVLCRACGGQQE